MKQLHALNKRLRNVWRRHGWRMFGPLVAHNLRYYARHWIRHGSFAPPRSSVDHIPGVETHRAVYLSQLGLTDSEENTAEPYMPIEEEKFRSVMGALPIRLEEYAFVDLGSGKGRALLLAAQLGFKSITGVEFSEELHHAALKNISAARGKWPGAEKIKMIRGDAAEYFPPESSIVCYLYNPFGADVMRKVVETWAEAMDQHSLDVWFVYSNPTQVAVIERESRFAHQFTSKGTAFFRRTNFKKEGWSPSVKLR